MFVDYIEYKLKFIVKFGQSKQCDNYEDYDSLQFDCDVPLIYYRISFKHLSRTKNIVLEFSFQLSDHVDLF